jgi:phosphopantothenoylcysteine decarboxylase/phosphopantothenate--cysteine ligase
MASEGDISLKGKTVILGITGSIAAYKACQIIRQLRKAEAGVEVIMTKNACEFITPLTIETLSTNKVHTKMFDKSKAWELAHISLAKKADIILIAPATADTIAKLAMGMADNLLCSTVLASTAPVVICPAMNTKMYLHKAVQKNMQTLRDYGYIVLESGCGQLACGDTGAGRLADINIIMEQVKKCLK